LAFAHIDAEGLELDALKGGVKTICHNYPVFTAELRVHRDLNYSRDLLDYIDNLGYDSYVVDEVCGYPHMDYWNILAIPRKLSHSLVHSNGFNLTLATEAIFHVDSTNIFEKVYPCCKVGGACCAKGDPSSPECCSQGTVQK
jgi:hypothetical protein